MVYNRIIRSFEKALKRNSEHNDMAEALKKSYFYKEKRLQIKRILAFKKAIEFQLHTLMLLTAIGTAVPTLIFCRAVFKADTALVEKMCTPLTLMIMGSIATVMFISIIIDEWLTGIEDAVEAIDYFLESNAIAPIFSHK